MIDQTAPMGHEPMSLRVDGGALRQFDLSRPYVPDMPKSPNHPPYTHLLQRRHGDTVREDGGSAANDVIVLGTHVGTHMDALAHISQDGLLHGGANADEAQRGGRFAEHGIDAFPPYVGPAVVLDIPRALGLDVCAPAQPIGSRELETAAARQRVTIRPQSVVLIRTGWGRYWDDTARFLGAVSGVPGIDVDGARWLLEHRVRAVGADTVAFEHIPAGQGHARLPVHRMMLVESGVNIIETMDLEDIAAHGVGECLLFLAPLRLAGATGAPVRPIAVVEE